MPKIKPAEEPNYNIDTSKVLHYNVEERELKLVCSPNLPEKTFVRKLINSLLVQFIYSEFILVSSCIFSCM